MMRADCGAAVAMGATVGTLPTFVNYVHGTSRKVFREPLQSSRPTEMLNQSCQRLAEVQICVAM